LAEPGGICVSKTAFDQLESKLPLGYQYLGEQTVKNIAKPVGAYRVLMEPRVIVEEKKEAAEVIPIWRRKAAIVGTIAVLVVIVAAAIWNFYLRPPPIEPASVERMAFELPDKPSIAVLPFANMSEDPQQEYLADGITENIISTLSQVPRLFVIARQSTFAYKGKSVTIQQVAEELGVRYVLEGSVQRSGDNLRITVQFIDAIGGHHLWSERYDRELKNIFALQDEIALKIMSAMQVELTEGDRARMFVKGTDNIEAYLTLLKGIDVFGFTKDSIGQARNIFDKAVALDPNYAQAYRWLGNTYQMEVVAGVSEDPKQSIGRAMHLTKKALALDDSLASAHDLLGWLYTMTMQHDKGIAECERAVALDPNYANGYFFLGTALRYAGRPEEAIEMYNKAIRLDPIPQGRYYQGLTNSYCLIGQYEEAISAGQKAAHLSPDNLIAHAFLAAAYSLSGREEEAHLQAAEVIRLNPKFLVESWERTMPFRNKTDLDLVIGALRKAGLK
jgi:adenylate cyclase